MPIDGIMAGEVTAPPAETELHLYSKIVHPCEGREIITTDTMTDIEMTDHTKIIGASPKIGTFATDLQHLTTGIIMMGEEVIMK